MKFYSYQVSANTDRWQSAPTTYLYVPYSSIFSRRIIFADWPCTQHFAEIIFADDGLLLAMPIYTPQTARCQTGYV